MKPEKDPRGPVRKIVAVTSTNKAAEVMLDCGHLRLLNPCFSYRVGDDCNCLPCREGAGSEPGLYPVR